MSAVRMLAVNDDQGAMETFQGLCDARGIPLIEIAAKDWRWGTFSAGIEGSQEAAVLAIAASEFPEVTRYGVQVRDAVLDAIKASHKQDVAWLFICDSQTSLGETYGEDFVADLLDALAADKPWWAAVVSGHEVMGVLDRFKARAHNPH